MLSPQELYIDASMKLRSVVTALDSLTVDETKQLVHCLGVKLNDLDDIASEYTTAYDRKSHFLKKWLDEDIKASWEKLASGLKQMGKNVLAEDVVQSSEVPVITDAPASTTLPIQQEVAHVTFLMIAMTLANAGTTNLKLSECQDQMKAMQDKMKVIQDALPQKESQGATSDQRDHGLGPGLGLALGSVLGLQHGLLVQSHLSTRSLPKKVEFSSKEIQKLYDTLSCYSDYPNYSEILRVCQHALKMRVFDFT